MATTALQTELKLSPTIRSLLGSLRFWILAYVCVEGTALAASWLGVAFWGSLAIDWFFEPLPVVRGVLLAVVAVVWLGVLVRFVLRRLFVPLGNGNMAMLLERRFPNLDESLLTAVALTSRRAAPAECNPQMLARTCREAAERIGGVSLLSVFNPAPLLRAMTASILLCASVVAFGFLFPDSLEIWARRNLAFSNEPWPRRASLRVEGFDNGVAKVARGGDLQIIAKADLHKELLPRSVQIRYRVEGGRRDRKPMTRVGRADAATDRYQDYSYTFQGILAPIRFDVVGEVKMGRDVRVADLRIEVVDSPTLEPMELVCQYPDYMGRNPRTLRDTGSVQIPRGTRVTVRARANKDLVGVQVDCTAGEQPTLRTQISRTALADDGRSFTYTLPSLDEDTTLLFTLSDTDGITGREPVPLALSAVADTPPQLTVELHGIGAAITPQARLPVAGRIVDDYGVGKAWFEYVVDQQEAGEHPLPVPADHPADFPLKNAALEVRPLKLTPGQKLLLSVKADDLYNLAEAPNVGTSERWLLDLVTADQLRAMLESRELVLRQRFEVILREVTETRDLLLRIDFAAPETEEKAAETSGEDKADDGSEPGDEPQPYAPEQQLARRVFALQRALTNSSKNAHEIQGVADGFDDIRLQLINNRIDTEELLRRIEDGIANPLHGIAQEMFPVLQTRLERLQESLQDENVGPQRRDLARRQADAILLEMRRVLDRMIELEDFNEAVELLRTIIKLQEELEGQTKHRHKQKIRELLED